MFGITNGVSNSTSLSSFLLLSSHGFEKGLQGSTSPQEPQNRCGWKRNVDESHFLYVEQKKVTPRVWRVGSSSHHPTVAPAGSRIPRWEAEGLRVPRSSPVHQPCAHISSLGSQKHRPPQNPQRGLHPTPLGPLAALPAGLPLQLLSDQPLSAALARGTAEAAGAGSVYTKAVCRRRRRVHELMGKPPCQNQCQAADGFML